MWAEKKANDICGIFVVVERSSIGDKICWAKRAIIGWVISLTPIQNKFTRRNIYISLHISTALNQTGLKNKN